MRKLCYLAILFALLCGLFATSQAGVIYLNDYEAETVGGGVPAWNWTGGGCSTHTATYQLYDGSKVRHHAGVVAYSSTNTQGRYGTKWDLTVAGNTSADPADYTLSFDIRNVSGGWNPVTLGVAVLTWAPGATSGDDQGHGYSNIVITQEQGWYHFEVNLANWANNWWQGANWDLTQSRWSIEIGMPWPGVNIAAGASYTQVWVMDNLKIVLGSEGEATDPVVLPANPDGSAGTLISQSSAEVTLGWNAGGDPDFQRKLPVNPGISGHYVYLSGGNEDPNIYLLDYVPQVHNADPALTNPYNQYGPIMLKQGVKYDWKVEEAINKGNGTAYGAGDPNNIMGQIWSFTTIAAKPSIVTGPGNATAYNGQASFTVVAGSAATHYQWFKVGSPVIKLTNGGVFSGTTTTTLTLTGATVANEGQYYCIAYNGDPGSGGIASDPSSSAWLWYPRLVSHYPFEVINVVDSTSTTPDVVSGLNAVLMQEGIAGLPVLSADKMVGSSSLQLNNADHATDPNGAFAQLPAGATSYDDITISIWIKPVVDLTWSRAFDFGSDTSNYLFLSPRSGNGDMRFAIRDTNNGEQTLASAPILPLQEWSQAVVTVKGNTGRLYRNGELVATNTSMTLNPFSIVKTNSYLGKSQYPDPEFDGMLDDLKIYNYALTTGQIAQDYLAIRGGWVCNREIYDLQYDYNNDCLVDLTDFATFATEWLKHYRMFPN